MIKVGQRAPAFEATDAQGNLVRLEDFLGKYNVVLYFYPRDFTMVCTRQACTFRDAHEELAAADTVVVGVSMDDASSHARFVDKHELNFPLLADVDGRIAKAYGVVGMLGELLKVPRRVTFVIDKQGVVRGAFRDERSASKHLEAVRATLEQLGSTSDS